jgi:HTH-type transcriptional regulator / antitoxin HigA
MTLTFNPDRYQDLLSQYQPKLIKTEGENERALAVVESLMHRHDRSPEEEELYQLLIVLIEKFEQEQYSPGVNSSPHSLLLFLMEQRHLTSADLVGLLGASEESAEVISGDRLITLVQAQRLGAFFQVDPELFLE